MMEKHETDKAYEEGHPLMTDAEYDTKFGKNATAEYVNDTSAWEKMPHPDKFGGASLDKISVIVGGGFNFSELLDWSRVHYGPYCCSYKYDGISVNLIYEDGVLKHAITKGAGNLGEDILRNVLKMKNVRSVLFKPFDINLSIKAEIMIDQQTFEEVLKNRYVNARNGAGGAARAYDGENAHHCSLKYYGVVFLDELNADHDYDESGKFEMLQEMGFEHVVWKQASSITDVVNFYNDVLDKRASLGYEIDGIVVTRQTYPIPKHVENGDRPRYSVAVKLPYSEKRSRIVDIIWQNGMKGRITPVAIIEPIELSGATVSRVTLKNLDEIDRLKIAIGDEILVSRRGDVIPNIESNLTKRTESFFNFIPASCPSCGKLVSVERPYVFCRNSACSSKALGDIKTWVNTIKDHFNYRGFADKRIEQLYDSDLIKDASDLYSLTQYDLILLPGIGEAVSEDILDFAKYTEIPFSVFLTGLNIEGINHKMAKLVSERYETFGNLIESWDKKSLYLGLQRINGFGDFRALALIEGLDAKHDTWYGLLEYIEVIPDKKPKGDVLRGKKILYYRYIITA